MYIVMTRVKIKPDTHEKCARLFEQSNPGLVKGESDWLGARMMFDPDTNTVTVMANWRSADSYKRMSSTAEYKITMQKFAEFFDSHPEVSINTMLVEMEPDPATQ